MMLESPKLKPEDCCREVVGETPHGGVRMVGYFFDSNGKPCRENDAKSVQIIEYDESNNVVFTMISHQCSPVPVIR